MSTPDTMAEASERIEALQTALATLQAAIP